MKRFILILLIIILPALVSSAPLQQKHKSVIAVQSVADSGPSELTIGKTDIGASTSDSSASRESADLTVPVGGMDVSYGYWYGTLGSGEYISMSIWKSNSRQGDCSNLSAEGDGSTKWWEVTWTTPVSLTGGDTVQIDYHPSNDAQNNTVTVTYYYDNDCSGCSYETTSPFNCAVQADASSSTRDASYFVSNYNAH